MLRGTNMLALKLHVALGGIDGLGEVLGNQLCGESGPGCKKFFLNGLDESRWYWRMKSPVVVDGQICFCRHCMDIIC